MSPTLTVEPIKKRITVEVPVERAFRVFTENFDAWWPRQHQIGKSKMKNAVLEQKLGGRWYEVGEDGTECDWGRVLAWDPPRHLVLAWQLDAQFRFDPNLVTEVEVHFTAAGPKTTIVDLEHRNLERYGEAGPQIKAILGSDQGWGGCLSNYANVAAASDQ